jgi:cobyrinic acid a,c-diamide synthase
MVIGMIEKVASEELEMVDLEAVEEEGETTSILGIPSERSL